MTKLCEFSGIVGQRVRGQYRVVGREPRVNQRNGDRFVHFKICDYTGSGHVSVWHALDEHFPELAPHQPVEAEIDVRQLQHSVGGNIRQLKPLATAQVRNAAALIPLDCVPGTAQSELASLVAAIESLHRPESRRFMNAVLLNPRIYPGFVTAPAGKQYHHAYPGGLLVHTVGCMRIASRIVREVYPSSEAAYDLALLGALVHDLGKVRTLADRRTGASAFNMRHEMLTLPFIYEALETMADSWQWGADQLGEIVQWLAEPASKRRRLNYKVAELVHFADAMDVMRDRNMQPRAAA